MKKSLIALAFVLSGSSNILAADIGSSSANVSMDVALYASITGLDVMELSTSDAGGSQGAVYSASDSFNLESNGQVRVVLSGSDLKIDEDHSVPTTFSLDGGGSTFDTASDAVHNQTHSVSASATLGSISDQLAGNYQIGISLTVTAL